MGLRVCWTSCYRSSEKWELDDVERRETERRARCIYILSRMTTQIRPRKQHHVTWQVSESGVPGDDTMLSPPAWNFELHTNDLSGWPAAVVMGLLA